MKLCECGCGAATKQHTRTNPKRGVKRGEWARFLPGHFSKTEKHRENMAANDPDRTKHVGADNGQWNGGRWIDGQGYVNVRVGPNKVRREHRVIAEQMIGRPLRRGEVVHHKNGDRQDNRPENLEVMKSQSEHMREHMTADEARRRGANGGRRRAALAALAPQEG